MSITLKYILPVIMTVAVFLTVFVTQSQTVDALVTPKCKLRETVNWSHTKAVTQGTTYSHEVLLNRDSSDSEEITKIRPIASSNVTINSWDRQNNSYWEKEGNLFLYPFPWTNALNTDSGMFFNINYTVNDGNNAWIGAEVGTSSNNLDNDLSHTCGTPLNLTQAGGGPPPDDPEPCQYNSAINADDPACVPPDDPEPCQYNSAINADDPACVPPTTDPPSGDITKIQAISIIITFILGSTIAYQFRFRG